MLVTFEEKKISPHFLKDMLGEDGWVLLDRVVKTHKKSLRRDKDKLDRIQKASIYFDEKMLLRHKLLLKRKEQSITGLLRDQLSRSPQYRRYLEMKRRGQTESSCSVPPIPSKGT